MANHKPGGQVELRMRWKNMMPRKPEVRWRVLPNSMVRSRRERIYAVSYEGVLIGTAGFLPRSSRSTRWMACSAITEETARFPTRRDATAWLVALYLEQRKREPSG